MPSLTLLLLLCSSMSMSPQLAAAETGDEAALLAFKAAAVGDGGNADALASWNGTSAGGFCSWEGVTCQQQQGRPRRVVALNLPSRGLAGVLSPAVGNLTSLRTLNLSYNAFRGAIPASIGLLRRLEVLDLNNNAFSGELPGNLTSCTNLKALSVAFNQLGGCVPPDLGDKLTRLAILDMDSNNLTGAIPASLANLSSLSFMLLAMNQLEGAIPPSLGSIPGLRRLSLSFNRLSGELPGSIYNLSSLERLQVQGNQLDGEIPTDIGSKFPRVQILSFAMNQFTGSIPTSLSNLTTLQWLDLSENRFSGHVPSDLGRLRALQSLNLRINRLQADDTAGWEFVASLSYSSQLKELLLSHNAALTGQFPGSISNLSTALQVLLLDGTGISGSIPSTIGNLVNLNLLDVGNTRISGVIPESIGKLENLVELHFENTELSGLVPSSIGNLSKLTTLDAHHAKLEGPIPATIGKLKNLLELDLSMNNLNGSIPTEIFKLPLISNHLNLSYNSLSGTLPSEIGSLRNLNQLSLSGNKLSGTIPSSIGECTVLELLWLDNNSFEGSIPTSLKYLKGMRELKLSMNRLSDAIPDAIGNIFNLEHLNLGHNNLSGMIPTVLQNLTSLSELDLSFNNLQGEVPKEGIFRIPSNFSVSGNNGLCGGITQLNLAPCQINSVKENRKRMLKALIISVPITCALFSLAFIIAFLQLKRRQKGTFLQLTSEEQYERVSYHALAIGTDGFSEANLLGKGGFGAVYKCIFHNDRTIAAVKVFNLEKSGSTRSFVAECEVLRRVRHRCLIKIITCCSSINHKGQEFKALVFEFMPNGSLNDWIHPKSHLLTTSNTLSLEQRLDIAIDIMDALDYLHNHCQPPIIHCDLKPSNILLDEDMSARVGDFGISRILPEHSNKCMQNSNSTVGMRGSIGYVAPEYGEGSSMSALGDVYSLGILLLEMFTGRSPTDDMFEGSFDLHKFSEDAVLDRIWEIVDPTMWLHNDAYNSTTKTRIQNCLVSVIALGISCSKKQPRERIPIQDATIELHAIRDSYLKFDKSLEVENGSSSNSAVIFNSSKQMEQ